MPLYPAYHHLVNILPPGLGPIYIFFIVLEHSGSDIIFIVIFYNFSNVLTKIFDSPCMHDVHRVAYPHGNHDPHIVHESS